MLEKNPDLQLFKAIEYYYGLQFKEDGTVNEDNNIIINNSNNFKLLIKEIDNGNPVVLLFESGSSGSTFVNIVRYLLKRTSHAVNGTQVMQSLKNPNTYKIAIYNNNSPGETQYLVLNGVKTLTGNVHYFIKKEAENEFSYTSLFMVKGD